MLAYLAGVSLGKACPRSPQRSVVLTPLLKVAETGRSTQAAAAFLEEVPEVALRRWVL